MPSKTTTSLDSAVLRALKTYIPQHSTPTITPHGGSGFSSTYQITATASTGGSEDESAHGKGEERKFFMKTSSDSGAEVMFRGEFHSLNAIADAVPSLSPRAYGFGKLEDERKGWFLVTDFLDMSSSFGLTKRSSRSGGGDEAVAGSGMNLAQKLAKLHTTPAPIPEGYSEPQFGFPVSTCCGDTPQDNTFTSEWADFFAERRLLFILRFGEKRNGKDPSLRTAVEKVAHNVVPRLLGRGHLGGSNYITPVVTHGDLWSGNKGVATMTLPASNPSSPSSPIRSIEEITFDPSSCYTHSEYDIGIMTMFGGFDSSFFREYHSLVPKTEPADEYDARISLYTLYHYLNHWAIFGGGYKSSALGITRKLIARYDGGDAERREK